MTGDRSRKLHGDNAGVLPWGPRYTEFHRDAWTELGRVVRSGGIFVLNVSDHIRGGEVMPVSAWHRGWLEQNGWRFVDEVRVPTPRMRRGSNSNARVDHENVYALERQ